MPWSETVILPAATSQTLTVPSLRPEMIRRPSVLKATLLITIRSDSSSVSVFWPAATSQTIRSVPPETIRRPSGLKATLSTSPMCPLSVSVSLPVAASQTLTVPSRLPETIRRPSGLKATL